MGVYPSLYRFPYHDTGPKQYCPLTALCNSLTSLVPVLFSFLSSEEPIYNTAARVILLIPLDSILSFCDIHPKNLGLCETE